VNRKRADVAAAILIGAVVFLGILSTVQLHLSDGGMGGRMDSAPVIATVGPLLMSLVVASILGSVYLFARSQLLTTRAGDSGSDASTEPAEPTGPEPGAGSQSSDPEIQRQVLDVLPDDERRILTPVVESPGLTQIEVRDRSEFSRSKVSQTITDLEERGLLYREPQGRTYRVYPAEDLDDRI